MFRDNLRKAAGFVLFTAGIALAVFLFALVVCGWLPVLIGRVTVRHNAEAYIHEQYPTRKYEIVAVHSQPFSSYYEVEIARPGYVDTHFTLQYKLPGKQNPITNTYQEDVRQKQNTWHRAQDTYAAAVGDCLQTIPGQLDLDAVLLYHSGEAVITDVLRLNQEFDLSELGTDWGTISLIVQDSTFTIERAAEILVKVNAVLTNAHIGYRTLDLTLICGDAEFRISSVAKADLESSDHLSRLQELWNVQEAKRQEIRDKYAQNGK